MKAEDIVAVLENIDVPPNQDVLLILDDHTRPNTLVPRLAIDVLKDKMGLDYGRLSILFATGMHRAMTRAEICEKIGPTNLHLFKTYQHNPFEATSPFLVPTFGYYRIAITHVIPHSYCGFSGGPKILVPGLASIKTAARFHGSKDYASDLHNGLYSSDLIHRMVYVVTDRAGDTIKVIEGSMDMYFHDMAIEASRKECTVHLPGELDAVVLSPLWKNNDFLQAINCLTVLQTYNPVRQGGVIAIKCRCSDGIGIHYLFNKGGPLHGYIDDSDVFGPVLNNRKLVIITPELNLQNMQEYFRTRVHWYPDIDTFEEDLGGHAYEIFSADCSIGRKENTSDVDI
jgi:hypothetical protein